jgi:hypothetical protein
MTAVTDMTGPGGPEHSDDDQEGRLRAGPLQGPGRGQLTALFRYELSAPRGALLYRPRSGHGLEEVSVGLMAYLDP